MTESEFEAIRPFAATAAAALYPYRALVGTMGASIIIAQLVNEAPIVYFVGARNIAIRVERTADGNDVAIRENVSPRDLMGESQDCAVVVDPAAIAELGDTLKGLFGQMGQMDVTDGEVC